MSFANFRSNGMICPAHGRGDMVACRVCSMRQGLDKGIGMNKIKFAAFLFAALSLIVGMSKVSSAQMREASLQMAAPAERDRPGDARRASTEDYVNAHLLAIGQYRALDNERGPKRNVNG